MGGQRKPVAKGDYIACMSIVDNALWDLVGKALHQPVWKLAGGAQSRVWAYAAGGYYAEGKGPQELAAGGWPAMFADGFRARQDEVGWPGVTLRERTAERVRAAREAIGPRCGADDRRQQRVGGQHGHPASRAWSSRTIPIGSRSRCTRTISPAAPRWRLLWICPWPRARTSSRGGAFRDLIEAGGAEVVQRRSEYLRRHQRILKDRRHRQRSSSQDGGSRRPERRLMLCRRGGEWSHHRVIPNLSQERAHGPGGFPTRTAISTCRTSRAWASTG